MADDAHLSQTTSGRSLLRSPAAIRRAPVRLLLILPVALTLAGCNASQGVDLSSQGAPVNTAGRFASSYNPYNPIKYAQTSGFYAGR